MLVAMLGALLGRCDACLIGEYTRSGPALFRDLDFFRDSWEKRGLSRAEYAVRVSAPAATMELFLEKMRRQFGSFSAYLRAEGGEASGFEAIRERFGGKRGEGCAC